MTTDLINELLGQMEEGTGIRKTLIGIRALTASGEDQTLCNAARAERKIFEQLLKNDDPKVRKNAALILGDLETEESLPFLFDAYEKEETLFVRPEYLKAAARMDCSRYLTLLREREQVLSSMQPGSDQEKHIEAEKKVLRELIWKLDENDRHLFHLPAGKTDVIVLTNKALRDLTISQIHAASVRGLGAGARFQGADLKEILPVRTYTELLFPLPGLSKVPSDPKAAGEMIAGAGIPAFLDRMHTGDGLYRYRVEIRGGETDALFIRKLCAAIDRNEKRLANSVSSYEVEIRLLAQKEGTLIPFLKLFTIPDERFAYRKGFTTQSIAPVNAALTVRFAAPWLREGARVLDPFCGVGTMLIERQMLSRAGCLYGTDIIKEAITLGRENAAAAGMDIHFVNRDFLTFTHEKPFDEIITDMPASQTDPLTGRAQTPSGLYRAFFCRVPDILSDNAVMILYTPHPRLVEECIRMDSRFRILAQAEVNERRGIQILVLRYRVS